MVLPAQNLAESPSGALASGADVAVWHELDASLPVRPADWCFDFVDPALDPDGRVAGELRALGFAVAPMPGIEAAVYRIALVSGSSGSANEVPPGAFVVTCLDSGGGCVPDFAGGGSDLLLLSDRLDAQRLVVELAGRAWPPRRPYRVVLLGGTDAALDALAGPLRDAGLDLLIAPGDIAAARRFEPEACVTLDLACLSMALALHAAEGLAGLPLLSLEATQAFPPEVEHVPASLAEDLVKLVMTRARAWRRMALAGARLQQLQQEHADLRRAIDAHAIVSVSAADGRIIDANEKFCEASGYARNELIGQDHRLIKSGRHSAAFFETMWQTISRGEIWHGEIQNRRRDGRLFWTQCTIVPVFDEQGSTRRHIAIRTDITEQKAVQTERERQARLLEAIRQSLRGFIVARDLATTSALLLDAVLAITDSEFGFIGEVQLDADATPFLRAHAVSSLAWSPDAATMQAAIREGGLDMRNLQSLYGTAMTSGSPVISNDPANDPRHGDLPDGHPSLTSFLALPVRQGDAVVGLLGLANRADGYDAGVIEFLSPLAATYGSIIEASRRQDLQRRVIDELVCGRETAELLIAWRREFRNRLNAMLGHAQILQLDESLGAEVGGHLAEIVDGGRELSTDFDALVERVGGGQAPAEASPVADDKPGHGAAIVRILVAEDNPANQAILRMQLDVLGYAADIADDGAAALARWQERHYDLILADRNMPHMDGLALTRAIRARERDAMLRVPVIAITATGEGSEIAQCLEAGMDDVLPKPIELEQLRSLLLRWLPLGARSAPTTTAASPRQEEVAGAGGAVLDTGYLARIVGGVDPSGLRDLVDLFTASAHADLPECQRLLKAGNGQALGLQMHRMKSAARMVGALRVAHLADTLEREANVGRLDGAGGLLTEIEHAVADVESAVLRLAVPIAPVSAIAVPGMPKRVLVVDDDPVARRQLVLLFSALGVGDVLQADSGMTALDAMATAGMGIDLVVTDLNMPGMDGIEFLRRLVQIAYRGRLILCSGVKDRLLHTAADLTRAKGLRLLGTLKKPAGREALLKLLSKTGDDTAAPRMTAEAIAVSPADISEALRRDEFYIEFQPKVDTRSLRLVGVEALARWSRQGRGIGPEAFIRSAERHGMIAPLSEVLLTKALIGGTRLVESGLSLQLAINLSAAWLADVRLPEFVMATIQATGFPVENLVLEVTETGVLADVETSMDVMTRLRLKGFKLSIDDFGIGYSTMEQLQRFPFGELKLDRSFVQGADNPTAREILTSTLEMARKLKLTTVAEGVETQPQLDLLRGLGCDMVQGWLIAPSMSVEDLVGWARATGGEAVRTRGARHAG